MKQSLSYRIKDFIFEAADGRKNAFANMSSKINYTKMYHIDSCNSFPLKKDRVRLALISLPRPEKIHTEECSIVPKGTTFIDSDACNRRLVSYPDQDTKKLCEQYETTLTVSLINKRADIILYNELAFPATKQGPSGKILELSRDLANEYKSLIATGSYHDWRTFYNTGHLFYPGCKPSGLIYHKHVSAQATTELISIPANRHTLLVEAFGLRIAVVICLDVADFSSVASAVNLQDMLDLLLVPTYSPRMDSLRAVASDISEAIPGMVVLTNYYQEIVNSSFLYCFGKLMKPTEITELPNNNGCISLYDLDITSYRLEKFARQDRCDARLKWLFDTEGIRIR